MVKKKSRRKNLSVLLIPDDYADPISFKISFKMLKMFSIVALIVVIHLLTGIVFPATMTGTAVTFDFSVDGTNWYDVKETDGTDVSYTISAGDAVRVDPSGWAFASSGFIRITSDGTEAADRSIKLIFRTA